MKQTTKMNYGLIGYPIKHSFSKKYFIQLFKKFSIDADFLLWEDKSLNNILNEIRQRDDIKGFSVTKPFKEQILHHLDSIDKTASEIGAVNSVKISHLEGKPHLKGYNTDVLGFEQSLLPQLQQQHKKALILGTGGASKAVAFVLDKLHIEYLFVSRIPSGCKHIRYSILHQQLLQEHTLIINTTPLGMSPETDSFPPIPYEFLTKNHLLYDLIYNPKETLFLSKGREKGTSIINGLEMLHLQANLSWHIWNNLDE